MAVTMMMTKGDTGTMGVVRWHCWDDDHGGDYDERGDPSPKCTVTAVTAAMTTAPWAPPGTLSPASPITTMTSGLLL